MRDQIQESEFILIGQMSLALKFGSVTFSYDSCDVAELVRVAVLSEILYADDLDLTS